MELGNATAIPELIPIFERNLLLGRLTRYLHQSSNPTVHSYLSCLARTHRAEADRIAALHEGDQQVQVSLWERLRNNAFDYLVRRGVPHSEAQVQACDAAQDAWEAIVTGQATYPFDVDFESWSAAVLFNKVKTAYLQRDDPLDQRETLSLDEQPAGWYESIPDQAASHAMHVVRLTGVIDQAFHSLSDEQQQAFVLFHSFDHSREEAAAALGCTYGAIAARCYRARCNLRQFFSVSNLGLPDLLPPDYMWSGATPGD